MSVAAQNETICRTCMSKNVRVISVFDELFSRNAEIKISDVLPQCASVQIYMGDGLPNRICISCADKLKRAYLFRLRCQESDAALRRELVLLKTEAETSSEDVCEQPEQFSVKFIKIEESIKENVNEARPHCETFEVAVEQVQNTEDIIFKQETNIILDNPEATATCDQIEFVNVNTRLNLNQADGATNRLHSCKKCKLTFETSALLKKHRATHGTKKIYKCNYCDKELGQKNRMKHHIMRHTGEVGQHKCEICGKGFVTAFRKKQHETIHLGQKLFLCNICGKRMSKAQSLKEHMSLHSGLKPFDCEKCGKSFPHKLALYSHSRTHTDEKPFSCETCGKFYKTKSILKKHQMIHGEERPFGCDVCDKRFISNEYLQRHRRTHSGEKKHECKECGSVFVSTYVLKNHMLTHTGERPFVCEDCGQTFRQRSTLGNHKKFVHKVKSVA